MADWVQLSFDLLAEIVLRFETIEDLIYFSAVCRNWNRFANMVKHKFNVKSTPWLLLAENPEDNSDCLRKVFNLFNNKYYQLKLPEISGCRCWGSAYGWLVVYDQDFELYLFNPLTKVRMSLPPISRLPYVWEDYFLDRDNDSTLYLMHSNFIVNVFVVRVAEDDFVVFVSYFYPWKKLAVARPGAESWTSIEQAGPTGEDFCNDDYLANRVAEVVCRGTRILILYEDASIGYLEVPDLSDPQKLILRDFLPKDAMVMTDSRNLGLKCREYLPSPSRILKEVHCLSVFGLYLVHSSADLFMVVRNKSYLKRAKDKDGVVYGTFNFMVYQLDFDNKKWSEIHHLSDDVFFVGNSSSMSVPKIGSGKCRLNCIYYTDDYAGAWDEKRIVSWGRDIGICNLQDHDCISGVGESCYPHPKQQSPLWFMPRFS